MSRIQKLCTTQINGESSILRNVVPIMQNSELRFYRKPR